MKLFDMNGIKLDKTELDASITEKLILLNIGEELEIKIRRIG